MENPSYRRLSQAPPYAVFLSDHPDEDKDSITCSKRISFAFLFIPSTQECITRPRLNSITVYSFTASRSVGPSKGISDDVGRPTLEFFIDPSQVSPNNAQANQLNTPKEQQRNQN
jgi:hypothetical protein